jgi:hypothetical protein
MSLWLQRKTSKTWFIVDDHVEAAQRLQDLVLCSHHIQVAESDALREAQVRANIFVHIHAHNL